MTKARDLALSFDALIALPGLLDELIDALLARAASGEFNGRDAAQVLHAAGLIPAPTAAAMGAFLKGVAGDSAATVLFKANLIAEATAAAMAAYLKGGRGDVGPLPTIVDGNTANGAPGSAAKVTFVATGKPGEYRADATLPVGYNGTGSGDVLAANNGSEFADKDAFLSNVGAGTGAGGGRAVFKAANAAAIRTLLGLEFDGNGKLLASLLPSLAVIDTFPVANQAAMLALNAQRGDIAVRSDLNKTFSLAGDNPAVLANWLEHRTPTDLVLSVAGKTGAISALELRQALQLRESLVIALGDETTAVKAGTALVTVRVPYACTLLGVRASLSTAQSSGSLLTVDVKAGGASVFSAKPSFNNAAKTTAGGSAYAIQTPALGDDVELTLDVTQVGDGTGKGLKVTLLLAQTGA